MLTLFRLTRYWKCNYTWVNIDGGWQNRSESLQKNEVVEGRSFGYWHRFRYKNRHHHGSTVGDLMQRSRHRHCRPNEIGELW